MTHASLFSGIGGFDLAAEWMGWTNLFNCEWEEFPRQVLKHHFPNAIQYGDIKELDATAHAGRVDILTGGFPCQPYSLAGKRKGKEDERHLWPEMLRVIRECTPRYVVGENVRGLTNWNSGMVFEEVCSDLEACGYSVQPFVLPAAGVGSCPHRRDRVWFVAYADDKGRSDGQGQVQGAHGEVRQRDDRTEPCHAGGGVASDTNVLGNSSRRKSEKIKADGSANNEVPKQRREQTQRADGLDGFSRNSSDAMRTGRRQDNGERESRQINQKRTIPNWENFPTVPPICGGDDGLPKELDGITFSKWRRESIKAYGNAIVPQVALQIFKAIQAYEDGTRI